MGRKTLLIDELPKIVAEGKKGVKRILEKIASGRGLVLQINELILPYSDSGNKHPATI